MGTRWTDDPDVPRGDAYDQRFRDLEASGADVHGEATLVRALLAEQDDGLPRDRTASVLDAGCGTGRVAIELARHGLDVVGVDVDPAMLGTARRNAPQLTWVEADLATLDLDRRVDLVVAAGNVLIFLAPGTEGAVVARLAHHLRPGGLLVAGFQLRGGHTPEDLDRHAAAAGLRLVARWSTWDRRPFDRASGYQVSVHELGRGPT